MMFREPPLDDIHFTFQVLLSHGTLIFYYSRSTEKYKKWKHSGLVKPTAKKLCLYYSPQQAALLHFTFLHYCIYLVKVSSQSSFTQLVTFFPMDAIFHLLLSFSTKNLEKITHNPCHPMYTLIVSSVKMWIFQKNCGRYYRRWYFFLSFSETMLSASIISESCEALS